MKVTSQCKTIVCSVLNQLSMPQVPPCNGSTAEPQQQKQQERLQAIKQHDLGVTFQPGLGKAPDQAWSQQQQQ